MGSVGLFRGHIPMGLWVPLELSQPISNTAPAPPRGSEALSFSGHHERSRRGLPQHQLVSGMGWRWGRVYGGWVWA